MTNPAGFWSRFQSARGAVGRTFALTDACPAVTGAGKSGSA